jgi:predicted dehydrogenase
MLIGYRTGDMHAPQLALTEALSVEAQHFVECVSASVAPRTGGEAGLRVVKLLEAASASLAQQGQPVKV